MMGAIRALPTGYNRLTTAAGVVTRRTRPMSRARAEAFAKCLNANYHFAQAQVVPMTRGSNRFFVAYLPSDPARQGDVFAQYVQQQVERAALEMEFYDFKPDGQGGWVVKTLPDDKTGHRDTYHVTADCECDCPHYRVRLRKAGVACKHIIAAACQPLQPVNDPTPARFNRYAPVNNGSPLGNAMYGATEENPFGPVCPLDDLDTYFAPAPVAPPARPRPDINKDFGQ
jgi:hypothetical protein